MSKSYFLDAFPYQTAVTLMEQFLGSVFIFFFFWFSSMFYPGSEGILLYFNLNMKSFIPGNQ